MPDIVVHFVAAIFRLTVVCSLAPVASAASLPATVQAIRIPEEHLDAILPGGLDIIEIDNSGPLDAAVAAMVEALQARKIEA